MTLAIKDTETVTIETQLHSGDVWNQTLTNKKTGEQFVIGLFKGEENAESSNARYGQYQRRAPRGLEGNPRSEGHRCVRYPPRKG